MTAFTLEGVKVFIGMPSHRELSPFTNASLIETGCHLLHRGIKYDQQVVFGSSVVTSARTQVAKRFLDSDCTHLFWIDSDMVWTPDDFLSILALATKLECVGATYPSKEMPPKFMINLLDKTEMVTNDFGCFEVKGFGLGFTCVQRKVIEQLSAKAPKMIFPGSPDPIPHIFREDEDNGAFRGEDMAFFSDILDLGYKVNLYPHINLGHVGPHVFRADFMAELEKLDNASRAASSAGLREQQEPAVAPTGARAGAREGDLGSGQEGRQGSGGVHSGVLPGRSGPPQKRTHSRRAAKGEARRADLASA